MVVDLKTGKTAVTGPQVREHAQLGIYQLSVEHGAVADLLAEATTPTSGGAELVQLRQDAGGHPKVQRQEPHEPDESGTTTPVRHLQESLRVVREESFAAQKNTYCTMCDFQRVCPAQPAGLTVLSPMSGDEGGAA